MKKKQTNTLSYFEKIGYPDRVLMLDMESYFDDTIGFGCQSMIEYITDPRFESLGCGFRWVGSDYDAEDTWFVDGPDLHKGFRGLRDQYGPRLEDITVVTKNAKFDVSLMDLHFGVLPTHTVDLDDLLRMYDSRMSHHLKDVCKMLKLKAKGDTFKFKGMHFDDIKNHEDPEVYEKYLVEYTKGDVDRQCEILDWVMPEINFTAHEAFMARQTLELFIFPRFQIDFAKAQAVRLKMEHQLAKVARDYDKIILNSDIKLTKMMGELLVEHGEKIPLKHCKKNKKGKFPDATVNMIPMLERYGDLPNDVPLLKARPSFAKDDDGCKWMQAHSDPAVRGLVEARIGIKSWPAHINKVCGIVKQAKCNPSKMLRVPIVYYGCHTGRWSGNEGINLLNMGSGGRGRKQHYTIGEVRGCLMAPEDRTLCIVDSAQIEARKLAWLAGQADLIRDFAEDMDPYSVLATDIFQEPVWKWSEDDVPEREKNCVPAFMDEDEFKQLKTRIKLYRGFGKDAILGAGYGMGWYTFLQRCLQNPFLRPYFDSGEYDEDFIKKIINTYRRKYRKITGFWKRVEKAFAVATRFKGQSVVIKIPNTPSSLKFYHSSGSTFIKLPSGRTLRYRQAHVTSKGEIKWRWGTLWGGVITENIDQASSRDLLTFWNELASKDRDYDFDVNMHCYDELVASVPIKHGEEHLARMEEIMCTCPDWAYGMPLSVGDGGCLSERYKK